MDYCRGSPSGNSGSGVGSSRGTGEGRGESSHYRLALLSSGSLASSSISSPSFHPFQFVLLYFFCSFTFIFMLHSHFLAPPHSHRHPL